MSGRQIASSAAAAAQRVESWNRRLREIDTLVSLPMDAAYGSASTSVGGLGWWRTPAVRQDLSRRMNREQWSATVGRAYAMANLIGRSASRIRSSRQSATAVGRVKCAVFEKSFECNRGGVRRH